jgi:alkylation response protein AidB-like acyl-CoA dehydrogenase
MSATMMTDSDDIARTAHRAAAACTGLDAAAAARRLAEDGVLGLLAPEEVGGLGLPLSVAGPVVAAGAAELLAFPLTEALLLARLLARVAPDTAAAIVEGQEVATIAWRGRLRATGAGAGAALAGAGAALDGTVGRAALAGEARWLVAAVDGGGALIDLRAPGVAVQEDMTGLDLERPAAMVTLCAVPATLLVAAGADWSALLADAQLLRAAESLGSAEACLEAAVAHVTQRRQFGRALVANQALRHELARHKLALENARHALDHALSAAEQDPQGRAMARLVARATAAEAGPLICEGAVQLHGGMGFTWDVPMHRHLRRVREAAAQCDPVGARAALAERIDEPADAEQGWAA